jgi:AraC-like DNA-binding protein
MDSRRLFSFFNLNGLENFGLLSMIIRLSQCETDDRSDRKLILAHNADLVENCFTGAGWRFLLETGESELCGAAAITSDGSGRDGFVPPAVYITLEQLVDKMSPNHNVLIGACFLPQPESFTPFSAARDALALARREKPVVLLAPGVAEANGVGINRHGVATVERALAYMHAHLAENLSLADVAAAVGSAPSHLSRLFSRQGGETFVHVFHRLRIAAARDLLRSGQYRVKEVCAMVGFRDQAYFSRVFRKYEGTNPANYWKRSGS